MTLQEWLYKEFGDDPSDGVMYSIPMYSKIWTAGQKAEREKYAALIAAAEAVVDEDDETPYAWVAIHDHHGFDALYFDKQEAIDDGHSFVEPLYRHPQTKARLTDEEIIMMWDERNPYAGVVSFVRAIERRINGEEE